MVDEKESVDEYSISEKLVGQLYPVLLANDGRRIDGTQRQKANKKWKTVKLKNIDTDEKYFVAQILSNTRRNVPKEERKKWFNDLGYIYKSLGMNQEDNISKKIAFVTGYKEDTVRRYLNPDLKDSSMKKELSSVNYNIEGLNPSVLPLINDNEKIDDDVPSDNSLVENKTVFRVGMDETVAEKICNHMVDLSFISMNDIMKIDRTEKDDVLENLNKFKIVLDEWIIYLSSMKYDDMR